MRSLRLEPARNLLSNLTLAELERFCGRHGIECRGQKAAVIDQIATRLDVVEIADALLTVFPKRKPAGARAEVRLDEEPRLSGDVAVHVLPRAKAGQGRLMLATADRCIQLRLGNIPLFLENRAPVVAADAGSVSCDLMFDGFVARRRLHPAAGRAPSRDRPFIIDEGGYGLRNGRLRFDLQKTGLISWHVDLLRWSARGSRPEYLLRPIA
jgi:hypothetical protein